MAGKVDKVIVTNPGALVAKYGTAASKITSALTQSVQADLQRGFVTEVVCIDDHAAMQAIQAAVVTNAADCSQNKSAIDDVYRAFAPDYLVILGSVDVIPHQDMKNPLYVGPNGDDPDQFAYGDLPYACDAPYSQDISDFKGPTRVVGRLPDRTGATDPAALIALIDRGEHFQPFPRSDYNDYHAVSAEIWDASTRQSARNMFGGDKDLQLVPPQGRPWSASRLRRKVHFYNCHGSANDPRFFGQPASGARQYPEALRSADLAGNVEGGTVVTAECCYGGQLYATSALQPAAPTCNLYLEAGAIGMWASTTIAYGPASGNGQADLITQYFIINILKGASLGRAALEARQSFVRAASPADPSDLKTLAQFNLYADASITPVEVPKTILAPLGVDKTVAERAARIDRRLLLSRQGAGLSAAEPNLRAQDIVVPDGIRAQLQAHLAADGGVVKAVLSFRLQYPDVPAATGLLKSFQDVSSGYVVGFVDVPADKDAPVQPVKLVIGRVQGDSLVQISIVESR